MKIQCCPTKGGDPQSAADVTGAYVDKDCRCCETHVCNCGPFLCICFCCSCIPFSWTYACPVGNNVWANFQGYCISTDGDKMYYQWLCCAAELEKKEKEGGAPPVTTEMERS